MFESLKRDPTELSIILRELNFPVVDENDKLSFDQFVQIMQKLESEMDKSLDEIYINDEASNEVRRDIISRDKPRTATNTRYMKYKQSQSEIRISEQEQDEPQPPKYEVVDEEVESQKSKEIHLSRKIEKNNYQTPKTPIPESNYEDDDKKSQSESSSAASFIMPNSPSEKERKIYGGMLPKHGVYFLPDLKVMDFIRVLNNYRRD